MIQFKESNEQLKEELEKLKHDYHVLKTHYDHQILELNQSLVSLRKSNEHFNATLDALKIILFELDDERRIFEFRTPKSELLFVSPDVFLGKTLYEILPPETCIIIDNALAEASETGFHKGAIYSLPMPDGVKWYELAISRKTDSLTLQKKYIVLVNDISERVLAEAALKTSETRFKTIFEDAPLGIALVDSLTGKIYEVNQMYSKITGRSIQELTCTDWISFTYPEDIQMDLDNMERLIKREISGFTMEKRFIRPDGSVIWVSMTISKLIEEEGMPLRHICMIEDITEQKSVDLELRLMHKSIESTSDSLFWMTPEGRIVNVNEAACQVLGYAREELLQLFVFDIDAHYNAEVWKNHFPELRKNQVLKFESEHRTKDGRLIPIEIVANYLKFGNEEFDCAVTRDITERKKIEASLMLAKEKAEEREANLRELNSMKDKFFSIISHDLRGPFNGFLGLTEIIANDLHKMTLDEIQEIAILLNNSASNLHALLGNLLEWSTIQRGLIHVVAKPFLLLEKVNQCLKLTVESAKEKNIDLNINIPGEMLVYTDSNILEGILRNLASNAIKFTPRGGEIYISAKSTDDKIEISIKDTGVGMSKNIIEGLFRLDVNTGRKGTEGESSSGLGLMICKDLIEKLDGELHIKSEEGKGSEFMFTLPALKIEG